MQQQMITDLRVSHIRMVDLSIIHAKLTWKPATLQVPPFEAVTQGSSRLPFCISMISTHNFQVIPTEKENWGGIQVLQPGGK